MGGTARSLLLQQTYQTASLDGPYLQGNMKEVQVLEQE